MLFAFRAVTGSALLLAAASSLGCAPEEPELPPQPASLTADELWYAQQRRLRSKTDEEVARKLFDGRELIVSATVSSVDSSNIAHPVLILRSPESGRPLRAEPNSGSRLKAADLAAGADVLLRCSGVADVVGSPMLRNCSFEEPAKAPEG